MIFSDAIVIKIRDGQVTNRPVYAAIGVTVDGKRDILGVWIGAGGEGAKYWPGVLTELRNRVSRTSASSCATASRACQKRSRRRGHWRWCRRACCI